MDIIDRLIQERKMRHISQTKLANKLSLTITTVHRYESKQREIPFNVVCQYAEAVGMELKLIVKE